MDNRTKNIVYSLILLVSVVGVWFYRKNKVTEPLKIEGETMATTYHITYFDKEKRNFKISVDSLLVLVNKSINNYDPESEISRFNKSNSSLKFSLPYLLTPLKKSLEVVSGSQGAFDPTVMPLVNAWGFGPAKRVRPDSTKIDSLKSLIGFEKIQFNSDSIWKIDPRTQLDFGGIGQGYGADVVSDFLKSKGVENFLMELGGEGMACGRNIKADKPWELGILDPNSTQDSQFFKAYVSLENKSFTTSGNYFNFREVDGKKYSHTIDPETGYPVQREILSASVFATDAITADAWATAFMVMGHERAIEVLKKHPELDAFLIYSTKEGAATFTTEKLSPYIRINP
jgi:FAD:protein FMN transferase